MIEVNIYAFEGEIIKLNEKDYANWKKIFSYCDLDMELLMLDGHWQHEQEQGKSIKKWYTATMYKLRYRNDQLKKSGAQEKGCFERLTDNSWAEGMIDNVVKIGDKR